MAIVCHFPVTIRVNGSLDDELLAELSSNLEQALVDRMATARRELVRRGMAEASTPSRDSVEEIFAPARWSERTHTYLVPSYDSGGVKVPIPVESGRIGAPDAGPATTGTPGVAIALPPAHPIQLTYDDGPDAAGNRNVVVLD